MLRKKPSYIEKQEAAKKERDKAEEKSDRQKIIGALEGFNQNHEAESKQAKRAHRFQRAIEKRSLRLDERKFHIDWAGAFGIWLASFVAIWAILESRDASNKQYTVMLDQVGKMQQQLAEMQADRRPWVSFGVDPLPLEVGEKFRPLIEFTNSGRAPALKMHSYVGLYPIEGNAAPPAPVTVMPVLPAGVPRSEVLLLPGKPILTWIYWNDKVGVSQKDLDAVKVGAITLWLVGRIEYFDPEGKQHYTMFKARYDPSAGRFAGSPDGNDAN